MTYVIACRAQVTDGCLDGRDAAAQFGEDLPLTEDGTYRNDGTTETVVCDPCYLALAPRTPSGRALLHELDTAIDGMRQQAAQGAAGGENGAVSHAVSEGAASVMRVHDTDIGSVADAR